MLSNRKIIATYCDKVIKNKKHHGELERKAVLRYKEDLLRDDLVMKWDKVDRCVKFIQNLKHTEGALAGQKIKLEPWQIFIVANLVGFYYKEGDFRRFNYGYIEVFKSVRLSF